MSSVSILSIKDLFYDQLRAVTAMIQASEFLIPCGDWNGHVGSSGSGYKEVHGSYGYGKLDPDSEGERILDYALAYDLFFGNTCFKKGDSHLITYRSGNTATHIDFVLFRKPAQTCYGCEGDSWRGGCSAASAPCVRHDD